MLREHSTYQKETPQQCSAEEPRANVCHTCGVEALLQCKGVALFVPKTVRVKPKYPEIYD